MATIPTAHGWYEQFRLAVAVGHTRALADALRRRAGLFPDPGLDEAVDRQARDFRQPGVGETGGVALLVDGYVLFATPDVAGQVWDALVGILGGLVVRVELGEFFSRTPLIPYGVRLERVRQRVRGGWRVADGNRRAAVCEAAAWEYRPTAEIFGMVYASLMDPDRIRSADDGRDPTPRRRGHNGES